MTIYSKIEPASAVRINEKQCDNCQRKFSPEELWEWQEFFHIRFVGGYGSVFGDGRRVECDLCQGCMKEMIGKISRSHTEGNSNVWRPEGLQDGARDVHLIKEPEEE